MAYVKEIKEIHLYLTIHIIIGEDLFQLMLDFIININKFYWL